MAKFIDRDDMSIKDDNGVLLATMHRKGDKWLVKRCPACSIGMYFRILNGLLDNGYDAL